MSDIENRNENQDAQPVLVRMHAHCLAGDVFGAKSCECAANIRASLDRIEAEGAGALIYLHQNATGFSVKRVADKDSLILHPDLKDVPHADHDHKVQRDVGIGAQILRDLKLQRIGLLTDRPRAWPPWRVMVSRLSTTSPFVKADPGSHGTGGKAILRTI
jgi:3,4-dihydroxy 2-butanone 4-phosphate synthase/GTP cyclohydrolase II